MKAHTNDFTRELKTYGKQQTVRITLKDGTQIDNENINSATPNYEAKLLSSVMKGIVLDSNVEIPKDTEFKFEYGLLVNGSYEYINYGYYVVYDCKIKEDTLSYEITCYDKMLWSMKDYEPVDVTYPCKLHDYVSAICKSLHYNLGTYDYANMDRTVERDYFTGIEYKYRDVLDDIAEATGSTIYISDFDEPTLILGQPQYVEETIDSEMYPMTSLYPTTYLKSGTQKRTAEIDEESFKDTDVTFGEQYGPINSVVLSRSAESDNVYLRDEDSVKQNGLCEIKIVDNQLMNWNDRSDYLEGILSKVNGLAYCLNDYSSTGIMVLDLLDYYTARVNGKEYKCLMLNDEQDITQGLEEHIYTEKPEQTQTDYSKADKTDRKINQAYIIVDKQNQQIEAVVSSNTETVQKVAKLEETVDKISSQMSTIADVTKEAVDYGTISFDDVNQSEPIMIKIHPTGRPVKTLYPSDTLYPHEREIQFKLKADDYSDSNKSFKDIIEYNLPADLYYYDNETYDEFVLDYEKQKCYITRRTSYNTSTDTVSKLTIEQTENYDYPKINLESGNYIITMPAFPTAYIYIKLMGKNIYTSQFATHVEVSSAIEQTAQEINLEVKKKVGDDEIISKINQSAEEIKINADKIDIDGKAVHFKTEVNKHIGTYTQSDIDKTKEIIMKDTQSQEDIEKYDTNQNGTVDANDWYTIQYAIKYNNGIVDKTGYYEITPTDPNSFISIYDTTYNNMNSSRNKVLITSLGLKDSKLNKIFTEGIDVVDVINEKMSVGTILSDSYIRIGSTQISSNGDAGTFILGKNNNSMCLFIQGNQPYITLYDTNNPQLINIYPNRIEIGLSTEIGENIKIPGTAEFGGNTKIGGNAEISGTVTGINFTKSGYGNAMCGKEMGHEYYALWANDSELQFWVDDTRVGFASDVSDKRLKDDIEEVPDNFIKAVGECHTFQYKPKDKGGKIFIGIIAQDLIEKFNKYGVKDYKKYAILEKTKYKDNDPNLYYFLNYQQYAIIKNRYLELKLIEQQEEIETLKNEIKKLK